MWFFVCILIAMIFIIYRYIHAVISSIRLRNQELVLQAETLNRQLELVTGNEQKAKREADAAHDTKSKLLSLISHEIRTPMNGVVGMATLLAATHLDSEQNEYADSILDCSRTLLDNMNEILISDMLDFSKVDPESLEQVHKNFDLRNCIEEVMDMFAIKAAKAGLDLL